MTGKPIRLMPRRELAAEVLRLELIVRDARRHADDLITLAAAAEWNRDLVDPLELRNRVTTLQAGLDRVHDRRERKAA